MSAAFQAPVRAKTPGDALRLAAFQFHRYVSARFHAPRARSAGRRLDDDHVSPPRRGHRLNCACVGRAVRETTRIAARVDDPYLLEVFQWALLPKWTATRRS